MLSLLDQSILGILASCIDFPTITTSFDIISKYLTTIVYMYNTMALEW